MGRKIKNVIGEEYGKLTIIEMLAPRVTSSGVKEKRVLAKCDCGVIKEYTYRDLRKGDTKSCGCLYRNHAKIGDTYGFWTVLEPPFVPIGSPTNMKSSRVKVKCVCGRKKLLYFTTLTRGKSNSCGCRGLIKVYKTKISPPFDTIDEQWLPIIGMSTYLISTKGRIFKNTSRGSRYITKPEAQKVGLIYNKERVLFDIPSLVYATFRGPYNASEFKVILINENHTDFSISNLFLAEVNDKGQDWVSRMLINSRSNTLRLTKKSTYNFEHLLTKKDILKQLIKQNYKSAYLGLPMDLKGVDLLTSISIDRIDNSKGYIPGNFNLTTRFENMGRGAADITDILKLCDKIKTPSI